MPKIVMAPTVNRQRLVCIYGYMIWTDVALFYQFSYAAVLRFCRPLHLNMNPNQQ